MEIGNLTPEEIDKIIQGVVNEYLYSTQVSKNKNGRYSLPVNIAPTVQDLYQECWKIYLEVKDKYNPNRGKPSTFIKNVLTNRIKNLYKANYKDKRKANINPLEFKEEYLYDPNKYLKDDELTEYEPDNNMEIKKISLTEKLKSLSEEKRRLALREIEVNNYCSKFNKKEFEYIENGDNMEYEQDYFD